MEVLSLMCRLRGVHDLWKLYSLYLLMKKALEAIRNTKKGLLRKKTVSLVSYSALRTFRHLANLWSLVALCVWPPSATWLGIPASLRCWMLDTIFLLKGNPSSHPDSIILCLISSTTELSSFACPDHKDSCITALSRPNTVQFFDIFEGNWNR